MTIPQLSDADNLQLRAWRRGELDADSTRAFETRLFFEPALLDAAQLDHALAAGIAEQPSAAAPPVATPPAGTPRMAAPWSLLLAAGLGAAAVLPLALPRGDDMQARANVEFVSIDVRRGSVDLLQVAPLASTGLLAMRLPVPDDMRGPLAARLSPLAGGATALQVDELRPEQSMVTLGFAPDALASGDYRVELRDAGDDGWHDSGLALRYQSPR